MACLVLRFVELQVILWPAAFPRMSDRFARVDFAAGCVSTSLHADG